MKTYTVEKFKLIISFTIRLVKDVQKKMKDGKLSVFEIVTLLPYIKDVQEFIPDIPNIKKALKEMSQPDMEELLRWLEANYSIPPERGGQVIENFFIFILSISQFIDILQNKDPEPVIIPPDDLTKK